MEKACSRCGEVKPNSEFCSHSRHKDGLNSSCRACKRQGETNHRFGLVDGEYEELFEAQGGLCAVCQKPETARYKGRLKNLAIDHDHETGEIRGLLCLSCNVLIGHAREDTKILEAAAAYLVKQKRAMDLGRKDLIPVSWL